MTNTTRLAKQIVRDWHSESLAAAIGLCLAAFFCGWTTFLFATEDDTTFRKVFGVVIYGIMTIILLFWAVYALRESRRAR